MPEKTQKYAVVWALPDGRIEYPDADDISYDDDDGYLTIGRRLVAQGVFVFGPHVETIAFWAPGTWERAEVAERIPDFELREGEPVAPAETEPDAGPGTFDLNPEHAAETPHSIRTHADQVEHDEHQAAADTRDRERVEKLILGQLTDTGERAVERMREMCAQMGAPLADDTTIPPLDVEGAWRALPDDAREQSIAYGLQLYRAGRDDTVAAWQPGNGGGSGNPLPTSQGGAHHA